MKTIKISNIEEILIKSILIQDLVEKLKTAQVVSAAIFADDFNPEEFKKL